VYCFAHRLVRLTGLSLMLVAGPRIAAAAAAPPASGQPQCPARVLDVAPLYPEENFASTTFLVTFETPGLAPAHMSGTVALYSGDRRYDVHFGDIVAAGSVASALSDATPVVVHFPAPMSIDAAYLAQLGGPSGGPCALAYVWTKPATKAQGAFGSILSAFEADIRKRAASLAPIEASAVAVEAKPSCASPTVRPLVLKAAPRDVGAFQTGTGFYIIETSLSQNGAVVDSWLWGSAARPDLSVAGPLLKEARESSYAPATFRCHPVSSVVFSEDSFAIAPEPTPPPKPQ